MHEQEFEALYQARLAALHAAREDEGRVGGTVPAKDILARAALYTDFLIKGPKEDDGDKDAVHRPD